MLETDEIEQIIPHRYPFLLVDRIIEIEEGKRAVGIKNVTANEWFFEGHFPGKKVMPGVLIVEALAQVAAVTLLKGVEMAGKSPLFGGIENMRFRKPVLPGDQLRLEFTLEKMRGPIGKGRVKATVDGKLAAEGTISFALVDLTTEAGS
ncbi:MAG: 3-hydroxyacyl-ACP dehydratase FabZ [Chloroflexi bacterium]|jgi:3-hydroxyacyl-[acyl-carrier-protein] dehydratase|nr:3-hydroxyacyl-ACP dehydratase FabZ [Dehalococcoidia bacterium]MCO5200438.1 3-hydroxyacyl-ACP dehydratase FabZ [Chloroflexota bacterium]MCZ7575996.1 3-hydroxyacyl-ACP dehydratase FabZ [Dehalococcoidia bacterium]NJD64569.1 3-hydroxyacyl-ACP dehydratase FabZ [Chloroflexota bacterium]PWB43283.1 MAG: 3-hydroxyacyl-[acyl-carrier-protein] dehydratase FabZ [Dehalococcoidia bacterium]